MEKLRYFSKFGGLRTNRLSRQFDELPHSHAMLALDGFSSPLHAIYEDNLVVMRVNKDAKTAFIEVVKKDKSEMREYCFVSYPIIQINYEDETGWKIGEEFICFTPKVDSLYVIRYGRNTGHTVKCSNIRVDGTLEYDGGITTKNHFRPATKAEIRKYNSKH